MSVQTILMGGLRWRQTLYTSMWGAQAPSVWLQAGLAPLWLASQCYRGLARGHLASYTWGVRRRRQLPCAVVSIGNLTLGGTGKTPLAMWVARWYQQQGWRVAILSRGYGARPAACLRVVSSGHGPLLGWQVAGDEPYLLACSLPGVPVLIGKDRYRTGRYAYEQFGAHVLILDDGFQHHALQRDLDIVLIDASNPFGPGALFPRGILREPLWALRRAHAIVLTRVEMATARLPTLRQRIRQWNSQQPIYRMATVVEALHQQDTHSVVELAALRQRRGVAFVGIGNPQAFVSTLTRLGAEVVTLFVFPDHHPYTQEDWQTMVAEVNKQRATYLITTEKDAVRLAPSWHASVPLYTLRIGVTFAASDPPFSHQLQALMSHADLR
jgi:tetraacyldisaccharide 4'-kinase